MTKKFKIVGLLVVASITFATLSILDVPFKKPKKVIQEPVSIEVGSIPIPEFAPLYVGDQLGYYQSDQMDAQIHKKYQNGIEVLQALEDGIIDLGAIGISPFVRSVFDKKEYVLIVSFAYSFNHIAFLADKSQGITQVRHLEGKYIGVVKGTVSQYFAETLLAFHKLWPDNYNLMAFDVNKIAEQLINGTVDAISCLQPCISIVEKEMKGNVIRFPNSNVYRSEGLIVTTRNYLEQNKKTIKEFLLALERSIQKIQNDDRQALVTLAKTLNYDLQMLERDWDPRIFKLSLEQQLIKTFEMEAAWMIRHGHVKSKTVPNFLKHINVELLDSIKPEAVKIIQ